MVKKKDDLLNAVKGFLKDDTSDEALAFLEDLSDTIDAGKSDGEDWKARYEQNDQEWRQKYKERFLSGEPVVNEPDPTEEEPPKVKTFEELFA